MSETKKCKECQTDIPLKAKRCSQCNADQRSWFHRHPILSIILGLFVLGIILSSTGDKKSSNQTGSVVDTSTNIQKVKEFQEVVNISTNSNKNSETFTLQGGKQKLTYKTTGDYIICTIYLLKEGTDLYSDGGIPVVVATEAEEDETILRKKAGDYYISINSNSNCEVTLYEER